MRKGGEFDYITLTVLKLHVKLVVPSGGIVVAVYIHSTLISTRHTEGLASSSGLWTLNALDVLSSTSGHTSLTNAWRTDTRWILLSNTRCARRAMLPLASGSARVAVLCNTSLPPAVVSLTRKFLAAASCTHRLRPRIYNSDETPRHPPLSCTCSTANCSPYARRPRVIW
jgi:hypothetical protein